MKGNSYINGLLLNFQFFTVVPIRQSLPMEPVQLRAALRLFPLLGLVKGCIYASAFWGLLEWTALSAVSTAFVLWLLPILMTGGLHLDGWMDASDAFFSYRDRERRLEIMQDPRIGAFGVLSVIILLAARYVFIYEIVSFGESSLALLIMAIPFLSQMVMGILLNGLPSAKKNGLAHFFQKGRDRFLGYSYSMWLAAGGLLYWVSSGTFILYCLFLLVMWLYYLYVRSSIMKHFGGITGDLLGAGLEGAETILWMTVWLLVSTVMA
ncbi:adenosylcobinamide-GDP ribazoletransferase [Bacillus ectoiniformans]|uniref:adenosylcobinamide-GDP ribazoletransferase n=1 Tax=Bacillus ectoiniformans TaxID=1494429 RepID=UPI00195651FC|nr:adenosylcobinamide-GDP ribazoletransferase [Bacillus ectoiniformans]MBM7649550.1 adenosylcobinamide-GDP ribazoletransferase [Bacillus ectoiniformans]